MKEKNIRSVTLALTGGAYLYFLSMFAMSLLSKPPWLQETDITRPLLLLMAALFVAGGLIITSAWRPRILHILNGWELLTAVGVFWLLPHDPSLVLFGVLLLIPPGFYYGIRLFKRPLRLPGRAGQRLSRAGAWLGNHKIVPALAGTLLVLVLSYNMTTQHIAVAYYFYQTNTGFAYARDVDDMKAIDRMEISTQNGTTEITDPGLIKAVTKKTTVANCLGHGCFSWKDSCRIRLYKGERLIRDMKQSMGVDSDWGDSPYAPYYAVRIFDNNAMHSIDGGPAAYAHLSSRLVEELEEALNRQGNSFFPQD